MARIIPVAPFDSEFFGGRKALEVKARNLFDLVNTLDEQAPGFAASADARVAFAIDGALVSDWSTPLEETSEVMIVPRIAGG